MNGITTVVPTVAIPAPPKHARYALWVAVLLMLAALTATLAWDARTHTALPAAPLVITRAAPTALPTLVPCMAGRGQACAVETHEGTLWVWLSDGGAARVELLTPTPVP